MGIDNSDFPNKMPEVTGLNSGNIDDIKDFAFGGEGLPGYTSPLVNMMRGIKILGSGPQMAPIADDTIGLSFISRPLCCLTDDNCSRHPQLAPYFKPAKNSPQQFIKCMLDKEEGDRTSSDLVDNKIAWIPLLMNLLKHSDGFGDVDLETSLIDGGFRGEVFQYVNGFLDENGSFSLRQTYHNVKGGMVTDLFNVWLRYIYEVRIGDNGIEPYPKADYENYIDFDCRIYHFFMNKNMQSISHMFMSIESIPTSYPVGALATIDNTSDSRRGEGQDEVTINFSSVGMRYDSWEIAEGFNGTTIFFNPDMAPGKREGKYIKIKPSEFLDIQYNVYPWVNVNTMELEWWADKNTYQHILTTRKNSTPSVISSSEQRSFTSGANSSAPNTDRFN